MSTAVRTHIFRQIMFRCWFSSSWRHEVAPLVRTSVAGSLVHCCRPVSGDTTLPFRPHRTSSEGSESCLVEFCPFFDCSIRPPLWLIMIWVAAPTAARVVSLCELDGNGR